ncbi:MAG: hypothetical protein HOP30_11065, partial [Cyclobacteriaceae bacterium]|nr:hypothetical protein [Cyclobacteriaceae bacterium]
YDELKKKQEEALAQPPAPGAPPAPGKPPAPKPVGKPPVPKPAKKLKAEKLWNRMLAGLADFFDPAP